MSTLSGSTYNAKEINAINFAVKNSGCRLVYYYKNDEFLSYQIYFETAEIYIKYHDLYNRMMIPIVESYKKPRFTVRLRNLVHSLSRYLCGSKAQSR